MAGHSKWHNIQHRKGAQDAKRGKIFTKLIREIVVASKLGGSEINTNPRLRSAVDKALSANMKKDTIDNAIKRGSGDLAGVNYEQVRYEGYGTAGTAIMVDCLTDNRKRTVAEVRHAFSKHGGNLGTDGSVAYLFTQQGLINFADGNEERIMEAALEAGADDIIVNHDESIDVVTSPADFLEIKASLVAADLVPAYDEITMTAATYVDLNLNDAEKFLKLFNALEDLDDVQNVYHNADIADEIMEQL